MKKDFNKKISEIVKTEIPSITADVFKEFIEKATQTEKELKSAESTLAYNDRKFSAHYKEVDELKKKITSLLVQIDELEDIEVQKENLKIKEAELLDLKSTMQNEILKIQLVESEKRNKDMKDFVDSIISRTNISIPVPETKEETK